MPHVVLVPCHIRVAAQAGSPCSLKDLPCLTDRKQTNNEEYGTTLILSVDDEPVNHMVIEECLSSTDYKVLLLLLLLSQRWPKSVLKHVCLASACVAFAPSKCSKVCCYKVLLLLPLLLPRQCWPKSVLKHVFLASVLKPVYLASACVVFAPSKRSKFVATRCCCCGMGAKISSQARVSCISTYCFCSQEIQSRLSY